ncbi:MAG: hypothetical protein KGM43_07300 [Planctomycetota bacterium]|nr:hypothetical protein [Planctomycetota bacterium]
MFKRSFPSSFALALIVAVPTLLPSLGCDDKGAGDGTTVKTDQAEVQKHNDAMKGFMDQKTKKK